MSNKPLISYIRLLEGCDLTETGEISLNRTYTAPRFSRAVSGLFYDSRKCEKDGIFFCKGRHFSAEYLDLALQKGALAVIYENALTELVNSAKESFPRCAFIAVKNVRKTMAVLSAFHFDHPMEKAITVAVTGTKGKTGTVAAICGCINESPHFKAVILNDALPKDAPSLTTPEPIDFHRAARECIDRGATHIVCEISSQGVKEQRIYGIIFDVACFLSFGSDHISPAEHNSLEDYFNSKAALFSFCKKAVINLDAEKSEEILLRASESKNVLSRPESGEKEVYTYSLNSKSSHFFAEITEESACGSLVSVTENHRLSDDTPAARIVSKKRHAPERASNLFVPFPGKFNVQNSLGAFAVCRLLGCSENEIFRGILSTSVPGRMEIFDTADGRVRVIVDYAHNKMSFEGLFSAAIHTYAPLPAPKITVVFGCSGEKALIRRYELPEVALKYSDRLIICEDDSGREPFDKIKEDILQNIEKILSHSDRGYVKSAKISVIRDRAEAIRAAVNNAYENNEERLILFLGRGRDNVMVTGNGTVPTVDDVSATLSAIKEYDSRLSLDVLFSRISDNGGKLIAVALDKSISVIEKFSASVFRFLRAGVSLMAICDAQSGEKLRESCFKNGVVCNFEKHRDGSDSPKEALTSDVKPSARASSERGELYAVSVREDIRSAAAKISAREKADALVYLTQSGGIIFNGKKLPRQLTEGEAALLSEKIDSAWLKSALKAIRDGVNTVAVIDGRRENALSFYGAGSGFEGTVIRKKVP